MAEQRPDKRHPTLLRLESLKRNSNHLITGGDQIFVLLIKTPTLIDLSSFVLALLQGGF